MLIMITVQERKKWKKEKRSDPNIMTNEKEKGMLIIALLKNNKDLTYYTYHAYSIINHCGNYKEKITLQ